MSTQLTTHRHPNKSEWILAQSGVDGHGQKHWQWTCINADGSVDYYPCSQHGWISVQHLPKSGSGRLLTYSNLTREIDVDSWYRPKTDGDYEFAFTENVAHWMPQPESPS